MKALRTLAVLAVGTAVCLFLNLHLESLIGPYQLQILDLAGINIILAVSLNLITGYTGQFSIGHLGFMAVGAYTSAAYVKYFAPAPTQGALVLSLLLGGGVAAGFGVLVGLPTLRLRGDYLAIATLGFGEIIRVVLLNLGVIQVGSRTIDLGAARGFSGIPHLSSFFWIYFCVLVTVVVILNLVRSSPGRALTAIREDELAAEVMGVNTTWYKVAAFVVGAFFAGVAGGLYAHEFLILLPGRFGFLGSVEVVVMVVLGGMGSTTGCVIAAVFLTWLPEWLRDISAHIGQMVNRPDLDLRLVIYSLLLIVLMLRWPQGLMGNRELTLRRRSRQYLRGRHEGMTV